MANEITVTGSLSVYKPLIMSEAMGRSIQSLNFTMNGVFVSQGVISIGITATAIPLGQVTAPHWAWFRNLDPTNYLTIRNGASGADLLQLFAGEPTPGGVPLLTSCVPYGIANTAPCSLEYVIFSY